MLSRQKSRNKKTIIKPRKFWLTFSLCLILVASLILISQIKPASGSTIYVPTDYFTIQDAVDNATEGDTIIVAPDKIYYEHVVVNKSLTIAGENPTTTIVDGTANGTVFQLEASQITITGFTIRNAGSNSAITSQRDSSTNDYHNIANNIIKTSQYGISLGLSHRNTVVNNTFFDNSIGGIYLNEADDNNITGNTISESAYGMRIVYSIFNTITRNTISQASFAIHISASSIRNTISRNIVSGRTIGIFVSADRNTVDHNTITESAYGIYFYNSERGEIHYNILTNNSYGIRLYNSSPTSSIHNVNNNKALNNDWGIELVNSMDNTFMGNWLQENTWGIYLSFSASNTFYRNNFLHNDMQAYADALNSWNMSGEGNYWSDYSGEDINPQDGIGDTPHPIIPGYDYYPLMDTWSEHDISIENVTVSTNETYAGPVININVTVKNNGKISPPTSETFNVTVKYGSNIIETQTVVSLVQEANSTLTFNWNTTGVVPGNYTIIAEASIVLDELNTDNNIFSDGPVKIKIVGDINGDGTVNIADLNLLDQAFGSTPSSLNWNSEADFNGDSIIDVLDVLALGNNYGKTA